MAFEHGHGNTGARGLDVVIAIPPGDYGDAFATGALGRLDGEASEPFGYLSEMGDFVLLANYLQQLRSFDAVLADCKFGFQLVINQGVGRPFIVPGNVVHISPVHVQDAKLSEFSGGNPVHISRRPSSG